MCIADVAWSFRSVYYCDHISSGMTYCILYLKEIYVFFDKRWLFKQLSYKTCCGLLASELIWYAHFCDFT